MVGVGIALSVLLKNLVSSSFFLVDLVCKLRAKLEIYPRKKKKEINKLIREDNII